MYVRQNLNSNQRGKVKYASICIARFYAKRLKCAQTWITQFYLKITPCLPANMRTSSDKSLPLPASAINKYCKLEVHSGRLKTFNLLHAAIMHTSQTSFCCGSSAVCASTTSSPASVVSSSSSSESQLISCTSAL